MLEKYGWVVLARAKNKNLHRSVGMERELQISESVILLACTCFAYGENGLTSLWLKQ